MQWALCARWIEHNKEQKKAAMKKQLIWIAIPLMAICCIWLSSCSKQGTQYVYLNNNNNNNNPPPGNNIKASQYFPDSIGDYWEYNVMDSTNNRSYTETITITGKQMLKDSLNYNVWQFQSPYGSSINYVRISNDTVKIYDETFSNNPSSFQYPKETFIIPFKVNSNWNNTLLDTYTVTNDSTDVVCGDTVYNSFNIQYVYNGPNVYEYSSDYFYPNIGLFRVHQKGFNQVTIPTELWTLKKYSLK